MWYIYYLGATMCNYKPNVSQAYNSLYYIVTDSSNQTQSTKDVLINKTHCTKKLATDEGCVHK